jgi:hypothetical protein
VAAPRSRALSREPAGRTARFLGPTHRRDEGAAARGEAPEPARWALDQGAADSSSPIGRYAGTLALLVLGRDLEARVLASTLRDCDDFPRDVADALTTIAAQDRAGYLIAVENVLDSFEQRTDFLEDVAVADTVLVLQLLAAGRDTAVDLPASPRLPS